VIADLDDECSLDGADGGIGDGDGFPSLTRMAEHTESGVFAFEQDLEIPRSAAKHLSGLARQDHNSAKASCFVRSTFRDWQGLAFCNHGFGL
jgi:hypothetical protein